MLLDMIHDNHGEPLFKTRYRDPAILKAYGYEGIVIPDALAVVPLAQRAALTAGAPARYNSVGELEAAIDRRVKSALDAGLKVFFYGDAFLLPRHLVESSPADYLCNDHSGRICAAKPAVYRALEHMVSELFDRWPRASGLVMRTGEVYPESTPHLMGSAVQESACSICRAVGPVARQKRFIESMHASVCIQANKQYVHRAWQHHHSGATMHDDPAIYQMVVADLPNDPRLCFSFKFTRGDFARGQPWNPVLTVDERPKWVEFQCEREFEGKGAFPNFQPMLWTGAAGVHRGTISDIPEKVLAGVWGWSRGGGWGGPYAQREEWIDANVFGLAALYRDRHANPLDIARQWSAATFGWKPNSTGADGLSQVLSTSVEAVRKLIYVQPLLAADGSHPPWLRDDTIDIDTIWTLSNRVINLNQSAAAMGEKLEGLRLVEQMRVIFEAAAPECANKALTRDLTNTLIFYGSFAGTIAHLFCGFMQYITWLRAGRTDTALAESAQEHLERTQAHWQHHTQRHAMLPGAPSVFTENTFWERTNACLEELAAV
jgi:hypothetical protein